MEVSRLEHNVASGVVGAGAFASEHAGDTHRLVGVADGKVVRAELILYAVEGDERRSLRHGADDNLIAFHHIGVEAVHRLAIGHHYVVGDIYDIVYRAEADDRQLLLQPVGTFLHVAVGNRQSDVAAAGLGVLNNNLYGQVFVVNGEGGAVGAMERSGVAVLLKPRIEVACDSPV